MFLPIRSKKYATRSTGLVTKSVWMEGNIFILVIKVKNVTYSGQIKQYEFANMSQKDLDRHPLKSGGWGARFYDYYSLFTSHHVMETPANCYYIVPKLEIYLFIFFY